MGGENYLSVGFTKFEQKGLAALKLWFLSAIKATNAINDINFSIDKIVWLFNCSLGSIYIIQLRIFWALPTDTKSYFVSMYKSFLFRVSFYLLFIGKTTFLPVLQKSCIVVSSKLPMT